MKPQLTEIPAYELAVWEGEGNKARVTNKGDKPLWSGKGEVPPVGSIVRCNDGKSTRCTVTGYEVDEGWLMVVGFRTDFPNVRGNLAGAEILDIEA